ncbi:MAG: SpvB/TcaC N-terminal domain-containing protein [Methylococcales bacterium]
MASTEETAKTSQEKQGVSAPAITLPKGGGAIHGMGEKFAANPVTGTGSMSIPIATSAGRSGFSPGLSLSYDSGAGNGVFGLGWNLSIPSITRKTDKGLPKYQDAEESDVFILSSAEDLVPFLVKQGNKWEKEVVPPRIVENKTYRIQSYRPRIEGLFARIERWTNQTDLTDTFWRSISKDNITTWYGRTDEYRIFDTADPTHIFSWLICESYDDKGNVIIYRYAKENSDGIDLSQAHEQNRSPEKNCSIETRTANRYLKHIKYGNLNPYLPTLTATDWTALPKEDKWLFEVVFDYGDHDENNPLPIEDGTKWQVRNDPFSSYRAGFEVRTYRLCQRVLMFHHFPDEQEVGLNCLIRSTNFTYSYEKNPNDSKNPIFSLLLSATQTGYKRNGSSSYLSKSLPPLEFEYSSVLTPEQLLQQPIRTIDNKSLENIPSGLSGANYQWVDLDGEGLSGILVEQADGWFYKRNLSANHQIIESDTQTEYTAAHFGDLERVAKKPNTSFAGGQAQFLDLAGNGQTDLVVMDGYVRGFYERTFDEDWESFRTFSSFPNLNTHDPNLKFIDLTGDGHADILISEDQAFVWHASLAEAGFAPAQRVTQFFDEEKGPRLVFADSTQSIYLADFSGDGLTDIVRIRNGEVCYWSNLGYCRFGTKVTMDNAPCFDYPDIFDQRRIRLADTDGSGVTDIIYLYDGGTKIYFNQSGNSWSSPVVLTAVPATDNIKSVSVVDLLGNGTACLVWSSPLPGDAQQSMSYLKLMGGQKPHLLIKSTNNLGAETTIQYAPSTKFYLNDKLAGKPWITKLPFPVHCVEKVTVTDKWRKTSFSSTYSYHHGYFDGIEREFRGFGRVEQVDVESYGQFINGNSVSPYITDDKNLYQPPVKTITWYHTGAFLDRERIINHFKDEYFPAQHPEFSSVFQEHELPQPDIAAENLNAEEWREALRACKGMMLRQEVYELDIDALEHPKNPEQLPVKLFTTAYHNCHIRCLQPQTENRHAIFKNRHAVFLVAESEAITYHYELDIRESALATLNPDPRIAHTLNLQFDEYANVLQSVAVVYPRIGKFEDNANLADGFTDALSLIHKVQEETHLAYSETRYTEDFGTKPADKNAALDNHRLRLPCEVLNYELTGIKPKSGLYFTLSELQDFQLSPVHQKSGTPVADIPYQQIPNRTNSEKRLVEHARTLFFAENLTDPLPFREHGRLGLTYEAYKLALTDSLLETIFQKNKLDEIIDNITNTTARNKLNDPASSGYLSGAKLTTRFASIPAAELTGQYWIRSGIAGFANDATQHFYLPERYTDPFDNVTTLEYDGKYDLFIQSSTDAMGNKTTVTQFDYRVLAPREMQDINGNLSEVYFDVLGLPTAMAVKGKGTEGDNLNVFNDSLANPDLTELTAFFVNNSYDETQAHTWLDNATARHVYYFGEIEEKLPDGKTITRWNQHPACACGIVHEQHLSQLTQGQQSPLQAAFEYSDGMGKVVVKKVQAEPEKKGQSLRWVANGKTILNNKGKPVKQYEPYFSSVGHHFEEPKEEGVTPIIYYDAVGRTVRTEMPDGSYSRVEFSPWYVRSYDQNDTVKEADNTWFTAKSAGSPEERRAAQLAAEHADTPALTILDSLGRDVISIAHNKVKDAAGVLKDEKYLTYTKLDAEGKPLWIRDARKNLVMQYITPPDPSNQASDPTGFAPCYDIAGNMLFQHSMDAGDRWMLNDATGKPMLAWDSRKHTFRTDYDKLHRPIGSYVKGADSLDANRIIQFEKIIYGDTPTNGLSDAQKSQLNLRGKPYQHYDSAGLVTSMAINPNTGTNEAFDFKGNPLRSTRQLVKDYKGTTDWLKNPTLEADIFTSSIRYDALNRPIQLVAPHSNQANTKFNIIRPSYNEANLLEQVNVWLEQSTEPNTLLNPDTTNLKAVTNIDYDAKGQRVKIEYNETGHPIVTEYSYDKNTFRLLHLTTTRPKHPEADQRTLQDLSYSYDPVGNITDIGDAAQQTVFFKNTRITPSNSYVYDALYRLIHAEGREHASQNNIQRDAQRFEPINEIPFVNNPEALQRYSEDYQYDPVGNILGLQHTGGGTERWIRWYQYALDSNRLLATRLPSDLKRPFYAAKPSYSAKYSYDAHGNMTTMPHLTIMEWDYKDQLRASQQQVVNNGGMGEKTYYVYDAGGQRVRKVTETQNSNLKDERIYLGGFEIYREFNGNNDIKLERETLHIMDDKQRVALVESRTQGDDGSAKQLIRYQLGNHLGSAALEVNDNAALISYEEYYPYGSSSYQAVNKDIKAAAKRYRYTGMERDEETGLSYHGARYYAPWLGRWVSCDPDGISVGINLYVYASNNPIGRIDSNGRDDKPASQQSKPDLFDPKTFVDENSLISLPGTPSGVAVAPIKKPFCPPGSVPIFPSPGRGGGSSEPQGCQPESKYDPCEGEKIPLCRFLTDNPTAGDIYEGFLVIGGILMLRQDIKAMFSSSSSMRRGVPKQLAGSNTRGIIPKQATGLTVEILEPVATPKPPNLSASESIVIEGSGSQPRVLQLPAPRMDLGPTGKATIPQTTIERRAMEDALNSLLSSGTREMGMTGHDTLGARPRGVDIPNLASNLELQTAYPDAKAAEYKFTASWSGLPMSMSQTRNLNQTLRYEQNSGDKTALIYINVLHGLVIRVR